MESPVVVDNPPEYHSKGSQENNDKGFPLEEDSAEEPWRELADRHPDIAARLRAHPAAAGWARKRRSDRRPDSADGLAGGLGEHFNRFPFDDIPPEFREHLPSNWGQRYTPQERTPPEEHNYHQQQSEQVSPPTQPSRNTISTQTDEELLNQQEKLQESQPQHPNTADLGRHIPVDPGQVDAEERNHRAMSAPPGNHGQAADEHSAQPTNVRHIPIFVEGRDSPIINRRNVEPTVNAEPQPHYAPSPPEREQYFDRDPGMGFHHRAHEPEFGRFFSGGGPFSKGFRQGHQPFAPQAAYQPTAAPSGRAQSPKPQGQHYTQIPVHHEPSKHNQQQTHPQHPQKPHPQQHPQHPQKPHPQQHPQQQHQQQQHPQHQQQQHPQHQQQQHPQHQQQNEEQPQTHHQPPPPMANDPIAKILNIQKDVLELMTEVENFTGKKTDKKYVYLDEMLTRNLIKLDDIETEGKENIRLARKEAIKCIQKCIAVLEAKADGKIPTTPQPNNAQPDFNGQTESDEQKNDDQEKQNETKDTNMDETKSDQPSEKNDEDKTAGMTHTDEDNQEKKEGAKTTPKKTKKVVKKRDKSKDKKELGDGDIKEEEKPVDVEMGSPKPDVLMETDAPSQ